MSLCAEGKFKRFHPMNKNKSKPVVYYPIFLNIQGKRSIVIGGGNVALRKIKTLLECRAKVIVISPKPHPEVSKLSEERMIRLIERDYKASDLKDAVIAIVCTNVKRVNRKAADEARKAGVLVNVSDDPERSDFIIPSFFRRGNLTVAVSTSGGSPALARKIRTKLEKSFGEEYGSLLSVVEAVRSVMKKKGVRLEAEAWYKVLDLGSLISLLKTGQEEKAKTFLFRKLKTYRSDYKIKTRL